MPDSLKFRKATHDDITDIANILEMAVERMLAEGKKQWNHNYPTATHVLSDVERGVGYVLECDGKVAGYGAVVLDGEPAYDNIEGRWLSGVNYVVVHRLAISALSQRRGLGMEFLKAVERFAMSENIPSFRIDTNFDNNRMLGLLKKAGFTYCGEVRYEAGPRKAFEKLLN